MQFYTKIKNNFRTFIYIFVFVIVTTSSVFAQIGGQSSTKVRIKLSPAYPKVGETFTATTESYSVDLDKAEISWTLDGKTIRSGFGLKSIELIMSKNYQNLAIEVTSPSGDFALGSISLFEKSLSIVWEGGDSYVPQWYKGKRYLASGGVMRAVAIANISDGKSYIGNSDLVFTWYINGKIQSKVSGLGKYYADLLIAEVYGSEVEIKVVVKPRLRDDEIVERMNISPVDPQVVLYEKDNIFGLIKRALYSQVKVNNSELELVAEPFFFSVDSFKLNEMKYTWKTNGKVQTGNTYSRIFSLGDKTGIANISVEAKQIKKLLQSSVANLKISF